ncbi:hypothetical protein FNW02_35080 [Komarekiella sp. 'clone 1']|uniref:Uncharacterized protein n=1 Tax=Komarekiella delphini-convector SJRDD-AB1 TaxID=2593771 RepID=A0AA40VV65_9NOST|nr:hypothetical protein [Komarekiella delphini-convector]MBD6620837.1 hypothetical protein [Komarekiella delphini-convector SJRDD-AB1]
MIQIHKCHAFGCDEHIHPRFLMCAKHWAMVPKRSQTKVLKTYRKGQEIDKNPSNEYLFAAKEAIQAVQIKEAHG